MKIPTSTQIRTFLSKIKFNPKETSPTLKIILETGSKQYYIDRAIELIKSQGKKLEEADIILAIRLLSVAILAEQPAPAKSKAPTRAAIMDDPRPET